MQTVLLVVHLIIAVALIGIVLMQRSEGGALGIGGGGGGGAGGGIFSARGVGNALTRTTAFLALGFFVTSIALTVLATHSGGTVFDTATKQNDAAPATGETKPATGESVLPNLTPAKPAAPAVPVTP
jgi:preprotein translocase subunit SecG